MNLNEFLGNMVSHRDSFFVDEEGCIRTDEMACPLTFIFEKRTGNIIPNAQYRIAAYMMSLGFHHADMIAKAADNRIHNFDTDRFEVKMIRQKMLRAITG
jgi:hypothetical protein